MNKNLKILKFSAIFLGFIFISLLIALIFALIDSGKKIQPKDQITTTKINSIAINGKANKIITHNNKIILLTSDKQKNQEIIIIDKNLNKISNKIKLINNDK